MYDLFDLLLSIIADIFNSFNSALSDIFGINLENMSLTFLDNSFNILQFLQFLGSFLLIFMLIVWTLRFFKYLFGFISGRFRL